MQIEQIECDNFVIFDEILHTCRIGSESSISEDETKVKAGTTIKIYEWLKDYKLHSCIGGRCPSREKFWGLYCGEDFDTDNYRLVKIIKIIKK